MSRDFEHSSSRMSDIRAIAVDALMSDRLLDGVFLLAACVNSCYSFPPTQETVVENSHGHVGTRLGEPWENKVKERDREARSHRKIFFHGRREIPWKHVPVKTRFSLRCSA